MGRRAGISTIEEARYENWRNDEKGGALLVCDTTSGDITSIDELPELVDPIEV